MTTLYPLHRLPEVLAEAKRERLFGKITFEFMDGDVKLVRKETTFKVSYSEEDHSNGQSSYPR